MNGEQQVSSLKYTCVVGFESDVVILSSNSRSCPRLRFILTDANYVICFRYHSPMSGTIESLNVQVVQSRIPQCIKSGWKECICIAKIVGASAARRIKKINSPSTPILYRRQSRECPQGLTKVQASPSRIFRDPAHLSSNAATALSESALQTN